MTRFDYEQARFNMIEQQIRPWDVLDTRVLDLLFAVRREDFVPQAHRTLAFADLELPLGNGYRMWTPKMEARVLQELMLRQSDRVLEIGTGAGYLTALMASQAGDLDNATKPQDMNAPDWLLHQLRGDLVGHWSVDVSGNWRLTFAFEGKDAVLVDYQDHH